MSSPQQQSHDIFEMPSIDLFLLLFSAEIERDLTCVFSSFNFIPVLYISNIEAVASGTLHLICKVFLKNSPNRLATSAGDGFSVTLGINPNDRLLISWHTQTL